MASNPKGGVNIIIGIVLIIITALIVVSILMVVKNQSETISGISDTGISALSDALNNAVGN